MPHEEQPSLQRPRYGCKCAGPTGLSPAFGSPQETRWELGARYGANGRAAAGELAKLGAGVAKGGLRRLPALPSQIPKSQLATPALYPRSPGCADSFCRKRKQGHDAECFINSIPRVFDLSTGMCCFQTQALICIRLRRDARDHHRSVWRLRASMELCLLCDIGYDLSFCLHLTMDFFALPQKGCEVQEIALKTLQPYECVVMIGESRPNEGGSTAVQRLRALAVTTTQLWFPFLRSNKMTGSSTHLMAPSRLHHSRSIVDDERLSAEEMDERRRQNIAYEYLCHLEEAKRAYHVVIHSPGTVPRAPSSRFGHVFIVNSKCSLAGMRAERAQGTEVMLHG
ncbi:Ras GTPase-activating-like protein IQGAP2 [Galemys pyrenaicus]|uniref:Ras GTPase-activating-like protein IQGAP2 n=1 Tax=Galemys pyrenaicus TaxID=202257 RepID=A0A8J6AUD1_GALPY|nr:Ras GTPase-activating-like protein IQGAP2 [Galemys pyrenaicus]